MLKIGLRKQTIQSTYWKKTGKEEKNSDIDNKIGSIADSIWYSGHSVLAYSVAVSEKTTDGFVVKFQPPPDNKQTFDWFLVLSNNVKST